jgi:hypothetical protein
MKELAADQRTFQTLLRLFACPCAGLARTVAAEHGPSTPTVGECPEYPQAFRVFLAAFTLAHFAQPLLGRQFGHPFNGFSLATITIRDTRLAGRRPYEISVD